MNKYMKGWMHYQLEDTEATLWDGIKTTTLYFFAVVGALHWIKCVVEFIQMNKII